MSILASAATPMIIPEIVKAVISLRGEPFTERNGRLATARVRDHLKLFRGHGLVHEIRANGSRFGARALISRSFK